MQMIDGDFIMGLQSFILVLVGNRAYSESNSWFKCQAKVGSLVV